MNWTKKDIPDQQGKTAIVTGSNSGIGFETAKLLAVKGAQVVLACRSESKAEMAKEAILAEHEDALVSTAVLDLSDLESVKQFAFGFQESHEQLNLLVNNAGVMIPPESKTAQGFELQFGVNHLGHFALTGHLLNSLANTPSSRVVSVSSIAHRTGRIAFDDLNFEKRGYTPWAAYSQSKLANLLFTLYLQEQFAAHKLDAIAVASHPGYTATDLQRTMPFAGLLNPLFGMKPAQGALPSLRAATDPSVQGGDYFGPHRFLEWEGFPERATRTLAAQSKENAERLWKVSEDLTGVEFDFAG